jgi:hydroxyacylglutathione hydrolase
MKATERTHAIKIPFKVSVFPELSIDRFAFVHLVFGDTIHLVDGGVAGAESIIWEYIREQGREPKEITNLFITHSHPDHIGSAKSIKDRTGCTIVAHRSERNWIEDTAQQFRERRVPGFRTLVGDSVKVDYLVEGGELLELKKKNVGQSILPDTQGRPNIKLELTEVKPNSVFVDLVRFPLARMFDFHELIDHGESDSKA